MRLLVSAVLAGMTVAGCATQPAPEPEPQIRKIVRVKVEKTDAVPEFLIEQARADEAAIKAVLEAQETAWNAGDIDAFMEGYWKSDELRFASGDKITRGWQATRDGYKARYVDKATMGTLAFDILELEVFSSSDAVVFGGWKLDRPEKGNVGGFFTLMLRKIDDQWLIVSDHTS